MTRHFFIATVCIIWTVFYSKTFGQCSANAGSDTTLCVTLGLDTVYLGGTPTVTGGTPPFTFTWTCDYSILNTIFLTASDFLDDTTSANPRIKDHNGDTVAFQLTVSDSLGNSCSDTVVIRFCGDYAWTLDWKFVYINQGDTALINPSVGQGCPPLTFQWMPNYNISDPNIASPLVWPDTTTTYSSTVIDEGGCQANGGTFDVFVIPTTINESRTSKVEIDISPNPMTEHSTIRISNLDNAKLSIYFYDIFGRTIYQAAVKKSIELKKSDFETGIYFYRAFDNDEFVGQGKLLVK